MALTLDPTLATAQDSDNRKPIVEIISDQFTGALPFLGQYMNTETDDEQKPEIISHSDGRIAGVYIKTSGSYDSLINLTYTNTDRTMWSDIQIYSGWLVNVSKVSICELDNGNLGVTWVENSGSTSYLKRMVVTVEGTVVSAASTIESWARSTYWVDSPHVVNLDDGYRMVYGFGDITLNDGSGEYGIWSRTSSDFLTWSADSLYYTGGHASYYKLDNPFLAISPSGEYLLFYDAVTSQQVDGSYITNIFNSTSSDLSTWSSGEAMTSLTNYGYRANTPSADFLEDGTCYLVYTHIIDVLHSSFADWTVTEGLWCDQEVTEGLHSQGGLYFDASTRELYFYSVYCSMGTKALCTCARLNVDTWEVTEFLTSDTVPGYHDVFANEHVWWNSHQQGAPYFSAAALTSGFYVGQPGGCAFVYNTTTQEYKQYNFCDDPEYGLTKNVDTDFTSGSLHFTWMDGDAGRLYLFWTATYNVYIGYMDFAEDADPTTGKYAYHSLVNDPSVIRNSGAMLGVSSFRVVPEANLFIITMGGFSGYRGQILVYTMDGALYKDYYNAESPEIHYYGANHACYYDGKLYCTFTYTASYGQEDRRGLMVIDLSTDAVTYQTPTYEVGLDDYAIYQSALTDDGRIIWGTAYGVMMYNPSDYTWTEYSNDTVDGFSPSGDNSCFGGLAWDPVNKTIFIGFGDSGSWSGIIGVSELGSWGKTVYTTGSWTDQWAFTEEEDATVGLTDTWGSIAVDEENAWWMLWTRRDADEQSNKWDNSNALKNLSDYLTDTVEATWNIDQPNNLKFSCAEGYLFDPTNLASTWSKFLRRGRVLRLRFGENVSGVEYWQNQSEFVVQSSSLNYARGTDPIINVECSDITSLWAEHNITCSTYYSDADPESVLQDLVEDFGRLTSDQYDIPSPFVNTHKIYYQWIDSTLTEAIDNLLDHFGYISNVNMDGDWSVKQIDLDKTPDHVYTNQTKIVEYSPDDSYATYTNKVTVKGEGRYFLEVSYPEENMGNISGTLGWWGCEEDKTFYYSEDQSQTCSNPRLDVLEYPNCDFFVLKFGGDISDPPSYEDPDGKYIIVTITAPNLIGLLLGLLAAAVTLGISAIPCDSQPYVKAGWCGPKIFALSILINMIGYVLGAESNYSIDVWARPKGHEKQTFQSSAEDTDLQNELNGLVIEEVIDDPLCYDQAECYRVANYELGVVMAQRKRIRFKKIAHLQDEITDVITIVHPYSGLSHNVMISNLTRTFEIPDSPQSDVGFFDSIDGWRME